MSLEATLNEDLKAAMLAKDERTVSTLRLLKSSLLYAKVADGSREQDMNDDAVIAILSKEAKKRQESADLYIKGGNQAKADDELAEKAIIDKYLPAQLSEAEISALVDEIIGALPEKDPAKMGQVIGQVKQKTGARADGGVIARLVKERLAS
jgi:uncharacterized protein YqeY